MSLQFHAQPYDTSYHGFYFESLTEFEEKLAAHPAEEFEIQFIDGETLECELVEALGINQGNIEAVLDALNDWEEDAKIKAIIAYGEGGYNFHDNDDPDSIDIDIYYADNLAALAEQFVDEGLYGDIPKAREYYIDYELIARDLGYEYSEITVNGTSICYRLG